MDARTLRGDVELLDAAKLHGRLAERDALHSAHLRVRGEQQIELALHGNAKWIFDERILPGPQREFPRRAPRLSVWPTRRRGQWPRPARRRRKRPRASCDRWRQNP